MAGRISAGKENAMFAVSYYNGRRRCGLLVFVENEEGIQTLGGFSPESLGEKPTSEAQTVVSRDTTERVLQGWVHPNDLQEVDHCDAYGVVVL